MLYSTIYARLHSAHKFTLIVTLYDALDVHVHFHKVCYYIVTPLLLLKAVKWGSVIVEVNCTTPVSHFPIELAYVIDAQNLTAILFAHRTL